MPNSLNLALVIKSWLLHILEHGTIPAVALAFAIALTNNGSWQREHLTDHTKQGTGMLSSAPTIDTMTLSAKDHEPVVASAKAGSANSRVHLATIRKTSSK
jgi:hypothetical protein